MSLRRIGPLFWTLIFFTLLVAGIAVLGIARHEEEVAGARQRAHDDLTAIANLKTEQLKAWRMERLREASAIQSDRDRIREATAVLEGSRRPADYAALTAWMSAISERLDFTSVSLCDPIGTAQLHVGSSDARSDYADNEPLARLIQAGQATFWDFHSGTHTAEVHLDVVVPVTRVDGSTRRVLGAFVFRIDPNRVLFPLIQSWPSASSSAEALLVRRSDHEVLFLSELRHREHTALPLRLPIDSPGLPAAMAARGAVGVVDGVDYRGVPVLAVARQIPDSSWFLVAKVDLDEVVAPIRERLTLEGALLASLILPVLVGIVVGLARERRVSLRQQHEDAADRQALVGHFDYITRYANDVILLYDADGRIVEANERAVETYGYSRDELLQLDMRAIRAPETLAMLDRQLAELRFENSLRFETRHVRKDGTTFPVESSARLIDVDGKEYLQVITRDITDRTRAEQALRDSEERHRILFDCSPVPLCVCDTQTLALLEVNNEAIEHFGYSREEMLGMTILDLEAPDNGAGSSRIADVVQPHVPHPNRLVRIRKKDGCVAQVEMAAHAVVLGTRPVLLVAANDVTEKRMLEEQLRQAQKMEAMGQLAGGVAHDFNNLLTVIKGNTQFVLEALPPDHPSRSDLDEISRAAEHATALTRRLLAFSRRQILQPTVVHMSHVIANLQQMLRRLIGEDVELTTHLAPDSGQVRADTSQLEQVVMNLAVNARDAMPRGGKLIIETADVELDEVYARTHSDVTPGPYVLLSISDTGTGIPPEVMAHIFEPFFTTKTRERGTGLGLPMVHGIVKQSGGHLTVYSEVGVGTTFRIYLPRVEAGEVSQRKASMGPRSGGCETILVVEDDAAVRKLAGRILEGAGYSVLEAESGLQAIAIAAAHEQPIHLLLTDVVMKGLGGPEVAKRLQHLRPTLKVLYMSGYTENAIARHGVLEPGLALLAKPFTAQALTSKVREVLDQISPAAPTGR